MESLKRISTTTMPMAIKLVIVEWLTPYPEMIPPLKSHDPLIRWSSKIMWQNKINISPLPQCLWSPISAGLWLALRGSYPHSQMTRKSHVVGRSGDKIKVSMLPQCPWPSNLAGWWRAMKSSHSKSHEPSITWSCEVT